MVVVVDVPDLFGTGRLDGDDDELGVTVVGGSGPLPSGSTTVVGTPAVDVPLVVSVESVASVDVVSVVAVVVVGVVRDVVAGRVSTFVRGTQVYSGSGMNPGGTTCAVSGATGDSAGGL